ncbi:phosphate system positive regulatory protein pho81, partial [Kappamyces sp. JEL0680]
KVSTKEIYLSRQVEIQPVFNTDVLSSLQDRATALLKELESKLALAGATEEETYLECPPQVVAYLELNQSGAWVEKHPDLPLSRVFLDYCTETSVECLQILLASNRVDCNITDDVSDHTALHLLAIDGRLDAIKLCFQYDAKLSLDYYGRSPLHYAAMYGHTHVCTYLIAVGADINQVDQDGNTPLIYSIIYGWPETLDALILDGASIEPIGSSRIPLTIACQHGRDEIVQKLLELNVKLIPNMDGLFPLHLACREGNVVITKSLIKHGSDVERKDAFTGWTPLFFAASEGHLECIRVLIEAGCKIDLTDDSG